MPSHRLQRLAFPFLDTGHLPPPCPVGLVDTFLILTRYLEDRGTPSPVDSSVSWQGRKITCLQPGKMGITEETGT